MKRILLSLMMFCGASSLCCAQNVLKFEYDASGNVIKRSVPLNYETTTFANKYKLKVGPSPTKGPVNVKVVSTSNSNEVVNCRMQLIIHPVTGTGSAFSQTYDKCEANVDVANPYISPFSSYSGVLSVTVLLFDNPQGAPTQGSVKIVKN